MHTGPSAAGATGLEASGSSKMPPRQSIARYDAPSGAVTVSSATKDPNAAIPAMTHQMSCTMLMATADQMVQGMALMAKAATCADRGSQKGVGAAGESDQR